MSNMVRYMGKYDIVGINKSAVLKESCILSIFCLSILILVLNLMSIYYNPEH